MPSENQEMPEIETTPAEVETPVEPETSAVVVDEPVSELGEGGQKALEAERTARKAAEKANRETQKRLDELTRAQESEQERLQREAEEGRELAAKAIATIRRANLLTALAEEGVVGSKAKAAVKLIDGVEYDDEDEPTNLADCIAAATAEYGDLFSAEAAVSAERPDLHAGARRDAAPDEDEAFAAYMQQHFPQSAGSTT
jgi:hypothetical protein